MLPFLPILCSLQYPIFPQGPILPFIPITTTLTKPPQGIYLTSRPALQRSHPSPQSPHPHGPASRRHRPGDPPLRNRRQRSGHRLRLQHALDTTVKRHALADVVGRIARRSVARPGEDHLPRLLLHVVVVMMSDRLPVDEVGIGALFVKKTRSSQRRVFKKFKRVQSVGGFGLGISYHAASPQAVSRWRRG